ncbi:hypothetical protein [Saliphagus infecundisoli]|uniref:hypothetical protein n=1 Tax=Saliphagus infecundisoli TaxID=1849069 RepID=UPI001CD5977B|nr:hypothetical protein [Saliphagus infecundisoli]
MVSDFISSSTVENAVTTRVLVTTGPVIAFVVILDVGHWPIVVRLIASFLSSDSVEKNPWRKH